MKDPHRETIKWWREIRENNPIGSFRIDLDRRIEEQDHSIAMWIMVSRFISMIDRPRYWNMMEMKHGWITDNIHDRYQILHGSALNRHSRIYPSRKNRKVNLVNIGGGALTVLSKF